MYQFLVQACCTMTVPSVSSSGLLSPSTGGLCVVGCHAAPAGNRRGRRESSLGQARQELAVLVRMVRDNCAIGFDSRGGMTGGATSGSGRRVAGRRVRGARARAGG